jgi:hypothetical protein
MLTPLLPHVKGAVYTLSVHSVRAQVYILALTELLLLLLHGPFTV